MKAYLELLREVLQRNDGVLNAELRQARARRQPAEQQSRVAGAGRRVGRRREGV